MKHNTDTLYSSIVGGGTVVTSYLLGGFDQLILAYFVLMASDYLTGILSGFYTKSISSKTAAKGLLKKGAMIVLVIVANQLDIVTGSGDVARNGMIMFLIGLEGISIFENLGKMGVKVPTFLSQAFSQLKDKGDGK
ncbi:phage holin family protein [Bacillus marasmi]|uniref:phage holin family protein n=1 Tax=Bacillus marasmi TaxID=1926279 RepID=UPI0011CC1DDB|nr:phage holin family protein [Bacillus marasmi]